MYKPYQELIASGVSAIFVTHDPLLVNKLCTRAIVLKNGGSFTIVKLLEQWKFIDQLQSMNPSPQVRSNYRQYGSYRCSFILNQHEARYCYCQNLRPIASKLQTTE